MRAIEYQDEGNLEEEAVRQSADCFLLYVPVRPYVTPLPFLPATCCQLASCVTKREILPHT